MNNRTRSFLAAIIAVGILLLAECAVQVTRTGASAAFCATLLLALLASTLKVRLPGVHGTISLNFLPILAAIALFSFSETVLLAAAACVVQCLWRSRSRARLVQVSFNVAALALSSGAAYRFAHFVAGPSPSHLLPLLALAACCYFGADTLLVSGVLSLVQRKRLLSVWQQCYLWSFPYYLAGAAVAGLMVATSRSAGWPLSLVTLAPMALIYLFYRLCVERAEKSLLLREGVV